MFFELVLSWGELLITSIKNECHLAPSIDSVADYLCTVLALAGSASGVSFI